MKKKKLRPERDSNPWPLRYRSGLSFFRLLFHSCLSCVHEYLEWISRCFLKNVPAKFKVTVLPTIGQCPELGLAGVFRLMGENGFDGANEFIIPRTTLPSCLYRTSALVLSGVGLGNFGSKAKNICYFIWFHISVASMCNQSLYCVRYFILHVNPKES